jgi:hypothetical protein
LHQGEPFERLVQQPMIVAIAEELLGDDMTLSSYSCRVMWPGAIEMGVHINLSALGNERALLGPSAPDASSHLDATGFHREQRRNPGGAAQPVAGHSSAMTRRGISPTSRVYHFLSTTARR